MFRAARLAFDLASVAALAALVVVPAHAQGGFHNAPATDSAAQASPIQPSRPVAATDAAALASPLLGPDPKPAGSLPGGLTLTVRLDEAADSGSLKNGQTLRGTLVRAEGGTNASGLSNQQANNPVQITVVGAVPAGKIYAAGELSLAVTQVGHQAAFTDILTFRGTPGKRDLPDSAPALGTNAGLQAGATLTFHSQGTPQPATSAYTGEGTVPGSVEGSAANGSMPKPGGK